MQHITEATASSEHKRSDMPVGAGTTIVVAVATSIILFLTVLVATSQSARAATPEALASPARVMASETHHLPAATLASFSPADDVVIAVAAGTTGERSNSLAAIVVSAVMLGWAAATADLWRALFNRVRRWDRFRV